MKKLSILRVGIILTILVTPVLTFAASGVSGGMETFAGLVNLFTNTVVSALAGLALAVGMLVFFYGIIEYIWARRKGDSKGLEDGNKFMAWGFAALFIMFSVYGIINLGQGILFGGKDVSLISIPSIQLKQGTSKDLLGGNNSGGAYGNSAPRVGSTIKSANGSNLGTVNSQNQVIDGMGNVVGSVNSSGQVVDNSGQAIATQQNTAQQAYDSCISNGNSSTECQGAYNAYGGKGIGGCPVGEVYDSDSGVCVVSVLNKSSNESCKAPEIPNTSDGGCYNPEGLDCDYTDVGTKDGTWRNGRCVKDDSSVSNSPQVIEDNPPVTTVDLTGDQDQVSSLPKLGDSCKVGGKVLTCDDGLVCDGNIMSQTAWTCQQPD